MKLKLLLAAAAVASTILTGFCQAGADNAIALKFNIPAGTKFSNGVTMDMNMTQTAAGNEIKVTTKITQGYIFEVTKDSAGWKTMNATFARMAMHMEVMDHTVDYDSDSPTSDTTSPMAKMGSVFSVMKNSHFTFTMNENGEIGKVTGLKEMVKKITAGMSSTDAAAALQPLGQTFNEESFKQNLQQSFAAYPGKPIKIGESWNKTLNMNNAGAIMKLTNTYTLDSIVGGVAKVKLVSIITVPEGTTIQGMPATITGTINGENGFDLVTGMPVGANLMMLVDMHITAQGQTIPMSVKTNIIIEGKKL